MPAEPASGYRVMVVEDHTLVRQAITKILNEDPQFEVVAEVSTGFDAVKKAPSLELDLVLMDLYLPGVDGITATRLILREKPDVNVVIVTASDEESDLFQAIEAGARGYILKNTDSAAMVQQLKDVISGGVAITGDLKTKLVAGLSRRNHEHAGAGAAQQENLTAREKDVLSLVAQGATNKEIGVQLTISENTVRAHVRALMQKLHFENRTQLAVFGVHEGYALANRSSNSANPAKHSPG